MSHTKKDAPADSCKVIDDNAESKSGSLLVLIGPNGFGKTTYLENKEKELKDKGELTLFLRSEIKLLDEVKDTVDDSQTMEFLLTEIISTNDFLKKQDDLFKEVDNCISENTDFMNGIVSDVLEINSQEQSKDFIEPNPKRFIKNLVKINQDDIKKKMGSGQRMQLLLKLVAHSSQNYIFLDEPEKHSHPSLLNGTARAINELVNKGKHLYIATNSPKLVSMLELGYEDLRVINDISHEPKEIPFEKVIADLASLVSVEKLPYKHKQYYSDAESLKSVIKRRYNRQFVEALFSKRVYLCEGVNDEALINASLFQFGGYYDDYCIFKTWGKINIPVFMSLFNKLGIEIIVLYDVDDESKSPNKDINQAIRQLKSCKCRMVELNPNIEEELSFGGAKSDVLAFLNFLEGCPLDEKFDFGQMFDN